VGELAGAVAHELNNPLGAALLASDLLEEALDPDALELEMARKQVHAIHDAIGRCRHIVNALQDVAWQSDGEREPVDLADIVQASLDLLNNKQQGQGATVVVDIPVALPVVVHRDQVGQVLLNLLTNAGQAMQGKGAIVVGGTRKGGHCHLSVTDSGDGIEPSVIGRIFEPFYTTKPRGQGTGLGLSISSSIITEHGGYIDVRSRPGEGATFTVVLQAAGSDQPKVTP
jgi:two-component system NtrC family sensor kinase